MENLNKKFIFQIKNPRKRFFAGVFYFLNYHDIFNRFNK